MNWRRFVYEIFANSREFVGWPDIYAMFDNEDKIYCDMLEEGYKKGLIKTSTSLEWKEL